jgi:eukaryotic-like serine/threonine-protein kinase
MKHGRWRQVEELFHAALERAPEERQAFFVQACGEDTELRLQVEHLISIDQRAGSRLERPVNEEVFATLDADAPLEGAQVGPYRILSPLGAGGMGKVYRARDTKLGRDVAIKTLPSEFARNPERLARLRREAQTLASLNHPHIAAIYGLEESADLDCLVLELVEGEALCGPLPMPIALDRAGQVAEALAAAHDKGIIHRDLKPANVKVTPQGRVKVLDFGLAKVIWRTESNPDLSDRTPLIGVETTAGLVGTPGYMSPEQASGGEVDQRTDTWAFGCLLYELLTGSRAFAGDTVAETIAAVMDREPDWRALPAKTPAKIRELLRQCLQKDVNRRLPNIVAAGRIIAEAQRGWNRWQAVGIAAAGLALLAAGAGFWPRGPARPPDRSDWVQLTRFPDPVSQPALSRDGRMLAFVRGPRTTYGLGQVYVKQLPDGEPVELTHDDLKKEGPTFSPDGARVAYTVVDAQFNWDSWVVPVNGGEPRPWLRNASGLIWTGPRQLLFSEIKPQYPMGIVAARDDRTSKRDVYFPRNARGMALKSQESPDGKWALVAEMSPYGNWDQCRVVPMDGSSQGRQIGPPRAPCSFGTWSPDGKWMYLTSKAGGLNHIWRQRFPDGEPQQFTSGLTEEEGIAMAADGRSLVTAVALENSTLWIHDARGERQISVLEGNAAYPKFAPDGKNLYYRIVKAVPILGTKRDPGEIWVADLESGHSERVAPGFEPLNYDISRNGLQVVMEIPDGEGKPRIWLAPVDRSSTPRQIPNVEGQNPLFGPDGDIFYRRVDGPSSFVYRVRTDGTALRKALEQPAFYADNISPNGRWIRIWGPLPGHQSAVVQQVPLDGGRPVVIGSNTVVQWSSSGDSLWISAGAVPDGRTYIVPVPKGNALPPFPEGGFHSEKEVAALPGARRLDAEGAPGPSIDSYAFERHTIQRNLYRIPIP